MCRDVPTLYGECVCLLLQMQRQLQLSLEAHGRYMVRLITREGRPAGDPLNADLSDQLRTTMDADPDFNLDTLSTDEELRDLHAAIGQSAKFSGGSPLAVHHELAMSLLDGGGGHHHPISPPPKRQRNDAFL